MGNTVGGKKKKNTFQECLEFSNMPYISKPFKAVLRRAATTHKSGNELRETKLTNQPVTDLPEVYFLTRLRQTASLKTPLDNNLAGVNPKASSVHSLKQDECTVNPAGRS